MKNFFKRLFKAEPETLRNTIEELIEESEEDEPSIENDERAILGNILNLRDLIVEDLMIPRADIISASIHQSPDEIIDILISNKLNTVPIYSGTLDQIIGTIHIEDVFPWVIKGKKSDIRSLVRPASFISPTMRTLDLLLHMRETGSKIALIVDEYGGIDGLVTFSDIIEEIIGDIQNAHEKNLSPQIKINQDNTIVVDARVNLEELEAQIHDYLSLKGQEQEVDTIGGLVFLIAGRVPVVGEIIKHPKGYEFEILEADPRRVNRIIIRKPVH